MTITTKTNKNGVATYFAEGKRIHRDQALQLAASERSNDFTIEYCGYDSKVGDIVDNLTISVDELKITVRREAHRHDIKFSVEVGSANVKNFYAPKDNPDSIKAAKWHATYCANEIAKAYIGGASKIKVSYNPEIKILAA